MLEKNKHILEEAIQKLPQYEPKAQLWDDIVQGLDAAEQQDHLQEAISELPTYSPPDFIWDNIEEALATTPKKTNIRYLWVQRVAAAAAIIGLAFGMFWSLQQTNESIHLAYSQETIEGDFMPMNWDEDEDAFGMIKELCKTNAPVCTIPEFKELNIELEELENLRNRLQPLVHEYDTDTELMLQLSKLERDRSDILKQMIAMI